MEEAGTRVEITIQGGSVLHKKASTFFEKFLKEHSVSKTGRWMVVYGATGQPMVVGKVTPNILLNDKIKKDIGDALLTHSIHGVFFSTADIDTCPCCDENEQ